LGHWIAGFFYIGWFGKTGSTMNFFKPTHVVLAGIFVLASLSSAGKQKIILRLREPLRAETIQIKVPELSNGRGETRDLETKLELGTQPKTEAPKVVEHALKLDMLVRNLGKTGVQVTLTMPNAGYVELSVMDFYGKRVATLIEGNLTPGVYPLRPISLKDAESNGIKFLTLRINGKVALKKVITKVR
jgi:hypothetical protein